MAIILFLIIWVKCLAYIENTQLIMSQFLWLNVQQSLRIGHNWMGGGGGTNLPSSYLNIPGQIKITHETANVGT